MPISIRSPPVSSLYQTLAPPLRPSHNPFVISTYRNLEPYPRKSFHENSFECGWRNRGRKLFSGTNGLKSSIDASEGGVVKKRKIVEHILLLRAKTDLSDSEEKDMLDSLYTSQYQTRGILAISLGRIEEPNADNFTHAVYMRFQMKEDLARFYVNSYYSGILKEHVLPYCYGLISVDYESEVEDDILPIFRRGEEFNYGVECVLLVSVIETAVQQAIEDALAALRKLIVDFHSLIVQATQGSNFNCTDSIYTHAAVIRFPSLDALEMFRDSSEYKDMWTLKFQPITKKALLMHFAVDPVGTELM